MRKLYTLIDENRNIIKAKYFNDTDILPKNAIPELLKKNFVKPKFNFDTRKFEEGATEAEINNQKEKEFEELKKKVFYKIENYGRALSMGKPVDSDLNYYERAYTNKYNLAKGIKPDTLNVLQTEMTLEGYTDLEAYKQLIISKYEQGVQFFEVVLQMAEIFRKRILADKLQGNYNKALLRMKIIDNLPKEVTTEQVHQIFNQVMTM